MIGLAAGESPEACADAVADEIARLVEEGSVRDRRTGVARRARPGDVAILFRSRASHREFERALEARGVPAYVYKGLGFFDADEIKDLSALLRYLAEPASSLRAAALLRSRLVRVSDAGLAALAPDLAGALAAPDPPAALAALDADDRAALGLARASVRGWLALVDRIPPADLLERALAESAYAFELAGPRRQQAWENVKKLRALARRIQNRGYATLARIADYIECLHTGDESNAAIEALDAVSLMTVHAAKGLEFPVVFVVNLAKGAGGPRPPVRVSAEGGGEDDEPAVSIGAHQSAADEDEPLRELEETKRLVYVALTRARDRLYLASVLKDGRLDAARGSLAGVLPLSMAALFARAAAGGAGGELAWTSARGRPYRVRVCPVVGGGPAVDRSGGAHAGAARRCVRDVRHAGRAAAGGRHGLERRARRRAVGRGRGRRGARPRRARAPAVPARRRPRGTGRGGAGRRSGGRRRRDRSGRGARAGGARGGGVPLAPRARRRPGAARERGASLRGAVLALAAAGDRDGRRPAAAPARDD